MTTNEAIKEILEIINPVIKKERKGTVSFPVEFTFYLLLERVKGNLDSLKILIENGIVRHDHAIGLISRNLLTDFITTGYAILLPHDKEETERKLYALYYSDIKKVDSFLKVLKSTDSINDEKHLELQEKYNENIYKIIKEYYAENELKTFPSIGGIIEMFIKSDLKDRWSEEIKRSYEIWILYSKYEHLGWNSYELTRNISKESTTSNLFSVLFNTNILALSCMEILNENDAIDALKKLSTKINEKLYINAV